MSVDVDSPWLRQTAPTTTTWQLLQREDFQVGTHHLPDGAVWHHQQARDTYRCSHWLSIDGVTARPFWFVKCPLNHTVFIRYMCIPFTRQTNNRINYYYYHYIYIITLTFNHFRNIHTATPWYTRWRQSWYETTKRQETSWMCHVVFRWGTPDFILI